MKSRNHKAALLLGGNLGDVRANLAEAQEKLNRFVKILRSSSLYKTEAWGMKDAPDFINQALIVQTELAPDTLLAKCILVEEQMGRARPAGEIETYQSRSLDIDILYYDHVLLDEKDLKLPHPKMHLRKFSLIPLREIAPDWVHPRFNKSIDQLIDECPDALEVESL